MWTKASATRSAALNIWGRFYVQEGNKRVSVLKYFNADSITANVTRVMPQYSDSPLVKLYYEFVEYYPLCQLYTLTFTQEGSFARLQKALGKAPGEKWSNDDRANVISLYNWVKKGLLRARRAAPAHNGRAMSCCF